MKKSFGLYLCLIIFGGLGIYLTFISSDTKKYDEIAFATNINPNKHTDSEGDTIYSPIYTFKVKGEEYKCEAKTGSSFTPKESKNKVYYDSKYPSKCLIEYEKGTNRIAGIICLLVTAVIVYLAFIRKEPENTSDPNNSIYDHYTTEQQPQNLDCPVVTQEQVDNVISKVSVIYKRVIIGVIIVILAILIIIDSIILKQTIKSKDYIDAMAILVDQKEENDTIFDDYIYSFEDKEGQMQEIIYSVSEGDVPEDEILIKYNENDPQDYYTTGQTLSKSGMIGFIVKIVIMILLMLLFSSRKALDKIHIH